MNYHQDEIKSSRNRDINHIPIVRLNYVNKRDSYVIETLITMAEPLSATLLVSQNRECKIECMVLGGLA